MYVNNSLIKGGLVTAQLETVQSIIFLNYNNFDLVYLLYK